MTAREPGFYWIRCLASPAGTGWTPGEVDGDTVTILEVLPPGEDGDEAIVECVRPGGSLTIQGAAPSQPDRYAFTHAGQMLRLRRDADGWRVVAMVQVGTSTAGEIVEVTRTIASMAAQVERADRRRRRQARKQRRGWA